MTTDQQVRLLMTLLNKGLALGTAAAKAGMSEGTARKFRRSGKLPSELRVAHTWRTRPDPFEEVWPEVVELLEQDEGLQAKTVFDELVRRYPSRFQAGQLRTLQRRFRDWCQCRSDFPQICRGRHRAIGRQCWRFVRQRPGRVHHRAVQDRGDSTPRSVAGPRGGRVRNPRVGRLVQPPTDP